MKKILRLLLALIALIAIIGAGAIGFAFFRFSELAQQKHPMHPELAQTDWSQAGASRIALGQRIYQVRAGCIDCHGADLGGGKIILEDPAMGSVRGPNISPARIGELKDADIARAIRYGVHPSGRSLHFMPSMDYEGMSADDLAALIAYVRSVPPVKREDHVNTTGPVAKLMGAFDQMPVLFPARFIDHSRGFSTKPTEAATPEFGKYLAHSCVGCHGTEFRGGKIPGGDPSWPPAPSIRLGEGTKWTRDQFTRLIRTGVSPFNGQALRSPMPVALLQQMDETELSALWLYLSSLR